MIDIFVHLKCLKKQASNNSPVLNISASHLATIFKIETTLCHKKALFDPPFLNLQPGIFKSIQSRLVQPLI